MKTIVINLYGAPSVGKSTHAADLYVQMKKAGYNVEMVREVAKEWAWEGRQIGLFDQIAIIGEQIKKESSLYNRVEYVITDSPIGLGSFYLDHNHRVSFMNTTVKRFYELGQTQDITYLNYIWDSGKPYQPKGRFETEREAKTIQSLLPGYIMKTLNQGLYVLSEAPCLEQIIGVRI